jgi:hypothetical protein
MNGGLATALMPSPDAGDTPVTSATPDTPDTAPAATPTATPDSSPPMMNQLSGQPAQPDLPRFHRTFMNTLKGIALGMMEGGVPGAIAGGVDPQAPGRQARANAQAQQAKITFANAQAAHEVAIAHQADVEYQALPQKLQQEAEGRGFDNVVKAKQAGYVPVASIALDQGTAQNSQNAMTAMQDVQTKFGGTVPSGLLYIHTGNGVTVLKLQDTNAALPMVNRSLRAQGMPQLSQDQFAALNPQDRDGLARNALTFTAPMDKNGEISQDSLNVANYRLATLQAQPDFNGKDALVAALQATATHYQAVLDSGAGAAAIRAGKAKGAEAVAAQPGTTAAKVAEIQQTAPAEAAAAGAKAGAEAQAKFPWELRLKQEEGAQNPVFAVNPKTGQREQITQGEVKTLGYTNPVAVKQPDIEKEYLLNSQLNDMQLNTSRYRVALNNMGDLSSTDAQNIQRIINNPNITGILGDTASTVGWAMGIGSMSQSVAKEAGAAWNALSPDKQDAVLGYLRMKNTGLLAQKVLTGMGRASKEALDIEIANMPAPNEGATVGNKKLDAWQQNINAMATRSVKLPGQEQPADVRARVESAAGSAATPQGPGQYVHGTLTGGRTIHQVGDAVTIQGKQMKVTKTYRDGTFDAQQ